MKHLHYFENKVELKKYLIFFYDEQDGLFILELTDEKFNKMYNTIQLYSYKNNELIKEDGDSFAIMNDDLENILYQSNNIEDCIDIIPFIYQTTKFNL